MGAVEFLVSAKGINLLGRQDFLQPCLKDIGTGHRPLRALHVSAGAVARDFPNTQVDIGMTGLMGDANDLLEAWRAIRSCIGRQTLTLPRSARGSEGWIRCSDGLLG